MFTSSFLPLQVLELEHELALRQLLPIASPALRYLTLQGSWGREERRRKERGQEAFYREPALSVDGLSRMWPLLYSGTQHLPFCSALGGRCVCVGGEELSLTRSMRSSCLGRSRFGLVSPPSCCHYLCPSCGSL
jgi:hypothetical protein